MTLTHCLPEPRRVLPQPRLQLIAGDPRASIVLGRIPFEVKVINVNVNQNWLSGGRRGPVRVLCPEAVDPLGSIL